MDCKYIPLNIEENSSLAIALGNSVHGADKLEGAIKKFLSEHMEELNNYLAGQKMAPLPDPKAAMFGTAAEVMTPETNGWQRGHLKTRIVFEFKFHQPDALKTEGLEPELSEQEDRSSLNQIRQMT